MPARDHPHAGWRRVGSAPIRPRLRAVLRLAIRARTSRFLTDPELPDTLYVSLAVDVSSLASRALEWDHLPLVASIGRAKSWATLARVNRRVRLPAPVAHRP